MNKREYAKANLDWLAAKAEEEGVMALPEGIYYKVLSTGNNDGKHPTPRSIVTAHYTGRTIKRQEIRLESWRYSYCFPLERPHKRLDCSHAADVRRR